MHYTKFAFTLHHLNWLHPEKETALLVIPKICANNITTLYHSSLFTEHQGMIKTYLTIGDKFFIPGLIYYLQ